ncbi:hypothetical protein SESBI_09020 [Sesbania bispinosa]|nr:hypothetical protein SESBI_09020 [Sesbania bispinosa]
MVNLPFPYEFYYSRKEQIGNRIVLIDDFGHQFDVPLFFGSKNAIMWQVVGEFKRFYGIYKTLYVNLKYEGGRKFSFQIKDEELNVTLTPALVHLSGKSCGVDRNESENVTVDDVVEGVENEAVLVQNPVQMISFQKPLPRKFLQDFVLKSWEELILQVHDGRSYSCKLLWRPKSEKKDFHLGKTGTNFVQEMALARGTRWCSRP